MPPSGELGRRHQWRRNATELFRFALIADTHVWQQSVGRDAFSDRSDAAGIRDGLLVRNSPAVYSTLLQELARFAASGGAFAVHAGDSVCGGASFRSPPAEYEDALRTLVADERAVLGSWPIHHVAGNHDLHPSAGGLDLWRRVLGNRSGAPGPEVAYRSLRLRGWRLVLLDSASAVGYDTDGHGRVDAPQLGWLHTQLEESAALGERVLLISHQLLVQPRDVNGGVASWLVLPDDMVENAAQVLTLLQRYPHVRLSLHGHVHANSLSTHGRIAFVSTASADEFPMQWREVIVRECEVELRTRSLPVPPDTLDRSRRREVGRGNANERNRAKIGGPLENHMILSTCDEHE